MKFLERFILDCRAKGMTKHSIETYQSNISEFLLYNPDPRGVSIDQLRSYLEQLRLRKLSHSTLKGYMSAVASFYDFLVFENEIKINPVLSFRKRYLVRLKCHPETRQLPSIEDMRAIIKESKHILHRTMIMILAKTGIRRGEFYDLKIWDLDFQRHIIRLPEKAKRTNRITIMDGELEATLKEYLVWWEGVSKTNWLWISNKGGRIHKDAPGMILAEIGRKLHIHQDKGPLSRRLTPHCMRHWFTTYLFRAGMKTQYIKFLRGDSMRLESWQIYNHIDFEEVRAEYLRCMPQISSQHTSQSKL